LRRLAPPYYFAIPLALLPIAGTFYANEAWRVWGQHLPPRTPDFGNLFVAFPECLFFMHGLVPGSEAPVFNGALWTLTPEVQLYLAFPLLIGLAHLRWRVGKHPISGLAVTVVSAVAVSVLYRVWLYKQIGYALRLEEGSVLFSPYHCLVNTFVGRWAEFALGMGAAGLVMQGRSLSPRVLVPVWVLCLGWFLVLRSDLAVGGWVGQLFLAMEPSPSPLADAVGGAAFALLILCCATIPAIARLFSARPLVRLGTFAYSLYLIHIPVIWLLHHILHVLLDRPLLGTGLWIFAVNMFVGLPLALFAARAFWWGCERPFLSRERQRTLNTSCHTQRSPCSTSRASIVELRSPQEEI
jgi:peptidoglycan/LPS O-acetylase OafA/YrhL